MKYRRLGNAGVKVSEISLGSWISCDDLSAKEDSFKIIEKAYDCGVNFFDSANVYSQGRAEIILGEALRKFPRETCVIATKVYWPMGEGPNQRGLSRKHIMEESEQSLKRLGTDYIDLYYCHWFDHEVPVEETLRAMDDLIRQGKILYFGVSNWTAAQISEGLRVCDRFLLDRMVANQPSYNMFDRYIEKETIPLCEKNGIGQVVYSPLAQGTLTGKYRRNADYAAGSRAANRSIKAEVTVWDYLNDDILEQVEKLAHIADEAGLKLSQLALAWILRQPNVASTLTGASKPSQVEENIKASDVRLSEDLLSRISEVLDSGSYTVKHNIVLK